MSPTPTPAERLAALSPEKQRLMRDFGFDHLKREDLKDTSRHFYLNALAMCEIMPDVDDLRSTLNKIWEGKNIAVNCMLYT